MYRRIGTVRGQEAGLEIHRPAFSHARPGASRHRIVFSDHNAALNRLRCVYCCSEIAAVGAIAFPWFTRAGGGRATAGIWWHLAVGMAVKSLRVSTVVPGTTSLAHWAVIPISQRDCGHWFFRQW